MTMAAISQRNPAPIAHQMGQSSCAFWTSQRAIPEASSQATVVTYLALWLDGYVQGVRHKEVRLSLSPMDAESAMDKYCAAHPEDSMETAAAAIVDEAAKP
jgi:hypothetical protein